VSLLRVRVGLQGFVCGLEVLEEWNEFMMFKLAVAGVKGLWGKVYRLVKIEIRITGIYGFVPRDDPSIPCVGERGKDLGMDDRTSSGIEIPLYFFAATHHLPINMGRFTRKRSRFGAAGADAGPMKPVTGGVSFST
jgi:hypothetical protein